MFCPKCGTQVADGVFFCRKCGAQLGAAQPQQYQQPAYQQPQYQQQEKPKNTKKIILIILAIAVVYGALQIINSIVNKDEPSVKYRPNQITDVTVTPPDSSNVLGSPWDVPAQTGGTANTDTNANPAQNTDNTANTGSQTNTNAAAPSLNAVDYSTDELPDQADFAWAFDNEDMIPLVNIYAANGAEYALGSYHNPFHKGGGPDGYALFCRPLH